MRDNEFAQTGTSAAMGFVIGAVCGATLALLFAPATGTETRRRIGDTARKLGGNVREGLEEAKGRMGDLRHDVKSAVDSGREAFQRSREAVRSAVDSGTPRGV